MIHTLHIFYFSGTGNARFAAEKIGEYASKDKINNDITYITDKKPKDFSHENTTTVVFVFPTHGFNAPPIVLKHLFSFPKGKSHVYLMNTRAGMKLNKIHTPGLSGIALLLPALILWLKGYKIRGFRSLDMPSNWITLHPGIRNKVVFSIVDHCTATLKRFSERIKYSKPAFNGLW